VADITAIVFDANVFGKGVEPRVGLVRQWAEACEEHDAELWIPEVVAWELAQRVLEAHAATAEAIRVHNNRHRKAGLTETPALANISETDVREALESAGAVIVDTDPDAAVAAIRDQVLQRGPAARKNGIKTGAADSAWVRSVIGHNGGHVDGLIFVSGDRDAVVATCADAGVGEPQVARDVHQLRHLLGSESEASPEQVAWLDSAVSAHIQPATGSVDVLAWAGLDRRYFWWPVAGVEGWELQETFADVGDDLSTKSVTFDAWSSSVTGRVRIPVSVEDSYARQDDWGDEPVYMHHVYEGSIEGDLTVYLPFELGNQPDPQQFTLTELDDIKLEVESEAFYD
jgi:hypothetical protein